MKQLTSVLTRQIIEQVKPQKTNIIRIESIDSPVIYKNVCQNFLSSGLLDCFIAKLAKAKYQEFAAVNRQDWLQALSFLYQGSNHFYSDHLDDSYMEASYVDFNNAITKWRNESSNLGENKTSLILLLGTEAVPDTGGLADTSFDISPKKLIATLDTDYSSWFIDYLDQNSLNNDDTRKAIHTLYRVIFSNVNIDLFKLSQFIDDLWELPISSSQELIEYICETLNTIWGIPSVKDPHSVPKVQVLSKGKLSNAKVIANAVKFIERENDIPTERRIGALRKQFAKYAEKNELDVGKPFPAIEAVFSSFNDFEECVIDFMCGKNVTQNRSLLLQIDYSIIDTIVGTKIKGPDIVEKAPTISGEPVEAYSKIFLDVVNRFNIDCEEDGNKTYPTSLCLRVERITLSNCVEEQKEEAIQPICSYLGGILKFFNDACIKSDGELLSFFYEDQDPFDFSNYQSTKDLIHCTGKWGDPCKIQLIVTASSGTQSCKYEYKWAFSPYSAWLHAFHFLGNVLFSKEDSYSLPTMVVCENTQDYLNCEGEDEFYAQLVQLRADAKFDEHKKEIHRYFGGTETSNQFDLVCSDFKDFSLQLTQCGLFSALEELRKVVQSYSLLMQHIHDHYSSYTEVQREKIPLLLNCFMITSNPEVISNCNMGEIILPAYHPVVLEKIDAKQLFIRSGFIEVISSLFAGESVEPLIEKLNNFVQLSSITQGVDTVLRSTSKFAVCKNMWEYFGVYYAEQTSGELISGNSFGTSIVTDDEDAPAMLKSTPMSNIIVRNVLDYIRTFPARVDGLNIAFIAPTDMQHIVSAIHTIAKYLNDSGTSASLNIKLICMNSKKNSATYLRRWLDSYFDDEHDVKVNTFLRNIAIRKKSDLDGLDSLLRNFDLCFNYNILSSIGVQFGQSNDENVDKDQGKFPMTFTPDTIAATHGHSRKINISQFQFLASKCQTQANHVAGYPDSVDGIYRAFKTLELTELQEQIIETSHNCCKWVVCIDPAIDRHMLEARNSKIIGFTTGEGSYGELNVTVSARTDVLTDIKQMLKKRITEKFKNWDEARLQKASTYCVDVLSKYMDGSRILKALNPYDYEIHNYLAYLLTLQMLGFTQKDDSCVVRSLISLDSYKHWFAEDGDNKRPDFMLIEIPKTDGNLSVESKLHIDIKIIECKMGFKSDSHIEKAKAQVEKGLQTMCRNWNPNNNEVMHRYWLNQLYRSIIFSPLNISNTSAEYEIIRNKIYGILSNDIDISWSGDIFAFWLDSNAGTPEEWPFQSSVKDKLSVEGISIGQLICHNCGQMFIQKMLLPPEERDREFEFNEIDQEHTDEDFFESEESEEQETQKKCNTTGETIPKEHEVYPPFIKYLAGNDELTRLKCLSWFGEYFRINESDRALMYDSNSHPKWETVFDGVITKFRAQNLLENSALGSFHITELGRVVALRLNEQGLTAGFWDLVNDAKENDRVPVPETTRETLNEELSKNNSAAEDFSSASLCDTTSEEPIEKRLGKKQLSDVRLLLGEDLRTHEKYYWEFGNKELNNRHLLINGNSGCGKTYCIQTLLMEASLQGVSSVVFDYTGGFANSKLDLVFKEALSGKIEQRIVKLRKIPVNPFAKHDIQIDDEIFVPEEDADVADKIAEIFRSVYSLGDQQRSAVYSAVLNGLKIHGNNMSFPAMVEELENIGTSYAKTVISKIQAFTDFNPFTTAETFSWADIRDSEGTIYVFQLAGYGREIQVLLTELLLWDIWSFCVKNGDESKPFVLVLDEAQNLSHGEKSPSAKILTEGRKFGISGWYATQFMKPQLSDDEIQRLQQAGQKLYFCPPDDGVLTVAKNIDITAQGAKDWSERLKKLKKGECVTCGNMVRNGKWAKYEPRIIKVTSLQERLHDD